MRYRFEVWKRKNGRKARYGWRFRAPNGKIVGGGRGYDTANAAIGGVRSIAQNSRKAVLVRMDRGDK